MSKLRNFLIILFLSLTSYLLPLPAHAQSAWSSQNSGRCVDKIYGDVATIQGIECLFANVLQVIVFIAGLAFFIMFLNGGFQYLLSGGDQKKVAASSSTLSMAIFGIIGVIGSWLIIKLISEFTGIKDLTNFRIPF